MQVYKDNLEEYRVVYWTKTENRGEPTRKKSENIAAVFTTVGAHCTTDEGVDYTTG